MDNMDNNIFGSGFDRTNADQPAVDPAQQSAAQPEASAPHSEYAQPENPAPHSEYAQQSTSAPQDAPAPQTTPAGGVNAEADGSYSMVHPAGGTTFFRAPEQTNTAYQPNAGSFFNPTGAHDARPSQDQSGAQNGYAQNPYGASGYNAPGYAPNPGYGTTTPGQGAYAGYTGYSAPQPEPKKEKKPKKGVSAGAVAAICAVTVLLSGGAAFGGTLLARRFGGNDGGEKEIVRDTAVLYRSVNTDDGVVGDATVNEVVTAVADSVVEINTEFTSTGMFQYISSGAGSGIIIDENGYILTNNHIITNEGKYADAIKVRLRDGTEYDAEIIGADADADIAVIKVNASGLTVAVFGDSEKLGVGQDIIAIGNPLGELGGTVTEGIVSALHREVLVEDTTMNLMQISAAINPGNSGGGVFNMKGELVGVVNAGYSGGVDGLGFAIPSNDAVHIAEELMKNGYVTGKTYIGISLYYTTDPFTAYRYFGSQTPGLFVYDIVKGYNDGVLKQGDRLTAVNGEEVVTSDDVKKVLKESKVGDKLKFTIYRDGKLMEVEVTVYEYVPDKADIDFEN